MSMFLVNVNRIDSCSLNADEILQEKVTKLKGGGYFRMIIVTGKRIRINYIFQGYSAVWRSEATSSYSPRCSSSSNSYDF